MGDKTAIEWCDATWNPIRARHRDSGAVGALGRIQPKIQRADSRRDGERGHPMLTDLEKLAACGATYFGRQGVGVILPDGTVGL